MTTSGAYNIDAYKQGLQKYLDQLIGGTILDCQTIIDDGDVWPVLIVIDREQNIHQVEIYSDGEGNGPGSLFIGDVVFDIVDE
jgi:hypothetical protein